MGSRAYTLTTADPHFMEERHAYYAVNDHGRRRGPYRATYAAALRDCSRSGRVQRIAADDLLELRRIPWGVVDLVFASGHMDRPDGIDVIFASAFAMGEERLADLAFQALYVRGRV